MSSIKLTTQGELTIKSQLALVMLPDNKKRRLLNRVATRVRSQWRRNIRQQTDFKGSPFEPRNHRKPKRKAFPAQKRKMLTGLAKYLTVTKLTSDQAILGWSRPKTGIIAKSHNEGMTTQGNAESLAKYRWQNNGSPCTQQQAIRLRTLNFQIKAKGGRMIRPSLQWIKDNVGYGKAGLIIRLLKKTQSKPRSWQIITPSRKFASIPQRKELTELTNIALGQVLNSPT